MDCSQAWINFIGNIHVKAVNHEESAVMLNYLGGLRSFVFYNFFPKAGCGYYSLNQRIKKGNRN